MLNLVSDYAPAGNQLQAIVRLTEGVLSCAKLLAVNRSLAIVDEMEAREPTQTGGDQRAFVHSLGMMPASGSGLRIYVGRS